MSKCFPAVEVILLGIFKGWIKGKYVGVVDQGNGIWRVFYRDVFLGYFNENKIRDKQVSIRLS